MNWGGFPVAFRFPVEDFSMETKRRCWSNTLSALTYADLTDTALLEAESAELFDPDRLIYMTIVAPKVIPPSRKNSLLWRTDGRLMSSLALYQPVVQENYLELYINEQVVATITPERGIVPQEGYENLFPDHIETKVKRPFQLRALVLPKEELPYAKRENLCRQTMKRLYDADESLYLKMLPLSPGGEGAVYSSVAFRHGRLFFEMIPNADGEKHRCLFGVLPGRQVLIDGFSVPSIEEPLNKAYGLGKAICVAKDRGFTDIYLCAKGLNSPQSEVKLMEDIEALYAFSRQLPLYDRVVLTWYGENGQIETESIDIDRRDEACVSSILSRRSGTAEN